MSEPMPPIFKKIEGQKKKLEEISGSLQIYLRQYPTADMVGKEQECEDRLLYRTAIHESALLDDKIAIYSELLEFLKTKPHKNGKQD